MRWRWARKLAHVRVRRAGSGGSARRDAGLGLLRHEPLDPVEQLEANDAEPADPCEGHHGREDAAGGVLVAPREVAPNGLQGMLGREMSVRG